MEIEDVAIDWKQRCKAQEEKKTKDSDENEDEIGQFKQHNKILFITPQMAAKMFEKGLIKDGSQCFSMIIDKIDMHQAFDVDQDLLELVQKHKNFPTKSNVIFKTIFTTNDKSDDTVDEQAKDSFNKIKELFMGPKDKGGKALVIQINEDQREVTKIEKINHYYIMCKNDLDKYICLFGFKKLGLVQGKVMIYARDL